MKSLGGNSGRRKINTIPVKATRTSPREHGWRRSPRIRFPDCELVELNRQIDSRFAQNWQKELHVSKVWGRLQGMARPFSVAPGMSLRGSILRFDPGHSHKEPKLLKKVTKRCRFLLGQTYPRYRPSAVKRKAASPRQP